MGKLSKKGYLKGQWGEETDGRAEAATGHGHGDAELDKGVENHPPLTVETGK